MVFPGPFWLLLYEWVLKTRYTLHIKHLFLLPTITLRPFFLFPYSSYGSVLFVFILCVFPEYRYWVFCLDVFGLAVVELAQILLSSLKCIVNTFVVNYGLIQKFRLEGTSGGDLSPALCSKQGQCWSQARLLRVPGLVLKMSGDRDCSTSWGNLFQCLTSKKASPYMQSESLVFQLTSVVLCPPTMQENYAELGSTVVMTSLQTSSFDVNSSIGDV